MSETPWSRTPGEPFVVERWPSEIPLRALLVLGALAVWALLVLSVVGIVYAALIGLMLFVSHVAFVAHVRGSAVRLGPDQLPHLHARVQELSEQLGLHPPPEAYLMESGGALNALATRFLRAKMIVLFSDLIEACGDDTAARDMVIGHELGHIRAGHLSLAWLLAPGYLVPFLGSAYSRACEYTCDRYGAALCGDPGGALRGLAILAAGGTQGPRLNLTAFARQRQSLDTGWMTLAKWLATHPPLCDRVAALDPSLVAGLAAPLRGPLRVVGSFAVLLLLGGIGSAFAVARLLPQIQRSLREAAAESPSGGPSLAAAEAREQAEGDLQALAEVARACRTDDGAYPPDDESLHGEWAKRKSDESEPVDPFSDGSRYGYTVLEDGSALLWSVGADGESATDDDIDLTLEVEPAPPRPGDRSVKTGGE